MLHSLKHHQVQADLPLDPRLLHLHRHQLPRPQPRAVHLRDARAADGLALPGAGHEQTVDQVAGAGADERVVGELLAQHALDVPPPGLRCLVEKLRELLLEHGRQHGALHCDRLAHLLIEPAVGEAEREQAVGGALVEARQLAGGLGRLEVEFVVDRDERAGADRAEVAGERRVVEVHIREVERAAGRRQDQRAPAEAEQARVCGARGSWARQRFGRRRDEGGGGGPRRERAAGERAAVAAEEREHVGGEGVPVLRACGAATSVSPADDDIDGGCRPLSPSRPRPVHRAAIQSRARPPACPPP